MGQITRWVSAGLAVAAAFSLSVWLSEALILPPLVQSVSDRWVLAAGVGTAVAALAALWGAGWARPESPERSGADRGSHGSKVNASGNSITVAGNNDGIISTGKNAKNKQIR